jgi:L-ascorbate metabolism protein UlaG (beta-lactamase superfamily)
MLRLSFFIFMLTTFMAVGVCAQATFEADTIKTSQGDLKITFVGHGTLIFSFKDKVIHVDPYGKVADYSKLPKADIILITHEHPDHLDLEAIKKIKKDGTTFVLTQKCADVVGRGLIMKNGDVLNVGGIEIQAVPAYNLVHLRPSGGPYHPKGIGNGYVITFGDKRVYVAGDTENIPEMKELKDIDVAFLPMNLPYTMTPEMVADAAKSFKPKVLYPYHTGDTDVTQLSKLMNGVEGVEVRIRKMK